MRIKLECCHADTCLPDYWSGHHLPHVQIPVFHGMSLKAIKRAIMDEIRRGCVMGSTEEAMLLSCDYHKDEKRMDALTKAAYAAVRRMKPAKKGQRIFFKELEKETEGEDTVYAFFVFVESV